MWTVTPITIAPECAELIRGLSAVASVPPNAPRPVGELCDGRSGRRYPIFLWPTRDGLGLILGVHTDIQGEATAVVGDGPEQLELPFPEEG